MPFIAENPLLLAEVDKVPKTPFGGTRGIYAGKDGFYSIDDKGNADKIVAEKDVMETINNLNALYYYGDMNIKPTDASEFEFTDLKNGFAMVSGKTDPEDDAIKTNTGDIVIPYECKIGGKKLPISEVGLFQFSQITSVIIPRGVNRVAFAAFNSCSELANVVIPDGTLVIDHSAFSNCEKITSLVIPESVTEIGYGSFSQRFLKDVYFKGTKKQWNAIEKYEDNNPDLLSATIHYNWCDGDSGGGGNSDSEIFNVKFEVTRKDELGNPVELESDKTVEEIAEAIASGKTVSAICEVARGAYIKPQFNHCAGSNMVFTFDMGVTYYTAMSQNNIWHLSSSQYLTADDADNFITAYSHRISNLLDPVDSQDAVTKKYVDDVTKEKVDTDEYEQFRDGVISGDISVYSSKRSEYATNSNFAELAYDDSDGNFIVETYAKIRPDIMTDIPTTLSPNQTYHFSEAPASIAFPSADVADGDTIYLTFMTGDTPPTIEFYTTNTTDIDIEIDANTGYEIYGKYFEHIGKWIVGYSEYTVPGGESQ